MADVAASNNLGGITLHALAEETLENFLISFPQLNAFTRDFTADIATRGETVTTRIASDMSAAKDFDQGSGNRGYLPDAVESTERVVSLNKHKQKTIEFDDGQLSKGGWPILQRLFVRPVTNALVKSMMDDVFALVTSANYGAEVVNVANEEAITINHLLDVQNSLDLVNAPTNPRYFIHNPAVFTALLKNEALQKYLNYGSAEPIRQRQIPELLGLDLYRYNALPLNTAGGKGLIGFAGNPDAIIIAARVPAEPMNFYGEVVTVQDETSGLAIQLRSYYMPQGFYRITATILYGVAIGNEKVLKRITKTVA